MDSPSPPYMTATNEKKNWTKPLKAIGHFIGKKRGRGKHDEKMNLHLELFDDDEEKDVVGLMDQHHGFQSSATEIGYHHESPNKEHDLSEEQQKDHSPEHRKNQLKGMRQLFSKHTNIMRIGRRKEEENNYDADKPVSASSADDKTDDEEEQEAKINGLNGSSTTNAPPTPTTISSAPVTPIPSPDTTPLPTSERAPLNPIPPGNRPPRNTQFTIKMWTQSKALAQREEIRHEVHPEDSKGEDTTPPVERVDNSKKICNDNASLETPSITLQQLETKSVASSKDANDHASQITVKMSNTSDQNLQQESTVPNILKKKSRSGNVNAPTDREENKDRQSREDDTHSMAEGTNPTYGHHRKPKRSEPLTLTVSPSTETTNLESSSKDKRRHKSRSSSSREKVASSSASRGIGSSATSSSAAYHIAPQIEQDEKVGQILEHEPQHQLAERPNSAAPFWKDALAMHEGIPVGLPNTRVSDRADSSAVAGSKVGCVTSFKHTKTTSTRTPVARSKSANDGEKSYKTSVIRSPSRKSGTSRKPTIGTLEVASPTTIKRKYRSPLESPSGKEHGGRSPGSTPTTTVRVKSKALDTHVADSHPMAVAMDGSLQSRHSTSLEKSLRGIARRAPERSLSRSSVRSHHTIESVRTHRSLSRDSGRRSVSHSKSPTGSSSRTGRHHSSRSRSPTGEHHRKNCTKGERRDDRHRYHTVRSSHDSVTRTPKPQPTNSFSVRDLPQAPYSDGKVRDKYDHRHASRRTAPSDLNAPDLSKDEDAISLRRGTRKGGKRSSTNTTSASSSAGRRQRSSSRSKSNGPPVSISGQDKQTSHKMEHCLSAMKQDDTGRKHGTELSVCESTSES